MVQFRIRGRVAHAPPERRTAAVAEQAGAKPITKSTYSLPSTSQILDPSERVVVIGYTISFQSCLKPARSVDRQAAAILCREPLGFSGTARISGDPGFQSAALLRSQCHARRTVQRLKGPMRFHFGRHWHRKRGRAGERGAGAAAGCRPVVAATDSSVAVAAATIVRAPGLRILPAWAQQCAIGTEAGAGAKASGGKLESRCEAIASSELSSSINCGK